MEIGQRLEQLRTSKKLSQGDIEKKTGLLRCYTSRVENGHTVPSIETLAKYSNALGVELYQLFIDGEPEANGKHKSIDPLSAKEGTTRALLRQWEKLSRGNKVIVLRLATSLAGK